MPIWSEEDILLNVVTPNTKLEEYNSMRERLQQHVDASLGAMAFSGSDVKAIVVMPVDRRVLEDQRQQLEREQLLLENALNPILGQWEALSLTGSPTEIRNFLRRWPVEKMEQLRAQLISTQNEIDRLGRELEGKASGYFRPIPLGNLQTISYSVHREKFPVRTLGRTYASGYTRGPRTIAGTMIFTVIDRHVLWELLQCGLGMHNTGVTIDSAWPEYTTVVPDQLPPFDVSLIASNEFGDNSVMNLYGVEIVNEGQTISIQDIITENTMQFVARDYDILRPMFEKRRVLAPNSPQPKNTQALIDENKESIRRRRERLNPYI